MAIICAIPVPITSIEIFFRRALFRYDLKRNMKAVFLIIDLPVFRRVRIIM